MLESGGVVVPGGLSEFVVHWAFSSSRSRTCRLSSSFSAVVAAMESSWFSLIEVVRKDGVDMESVPMIEDGGLLFLASIMVPKDTKLVSSVVGLVEGDWEEFRASLRPSNCMVASDPKSSSNMSSKRKSSLDWNRYEFSSKMTPSQYSMASTVNHSAVEGCSFC